MTLHQHYHDHMPDVRIISYCKIVFRLVVVRFRVPFVYPNFTFAGSEFNNFYVLCDITF